MERGFEFQKQRKELADTLREQRGEGEDGKQTARETLATAKESEEYQGDKTLHHVAREIPKDALEKASAALEMEDDPEKWNVVDVNTLLSPEVKAVIDAQILIQAVHIMSRNEDPADGFATSHRTTLGALGELTGDPYAKSHEIDWKDEELKEERSKQQDRRIEKYNKFWDVLTGGRFLDPHNINHFVGAQAANRTGENFFNQITSFNRHSVIGHSGVETSNEFWINSRGSGYAPYIEKPLIIVSPHNPGARAFLEQAFRYDQMERDDKKVIEDFFQARPLPDDGKGSSIMGYSLKVEKSYAQQLKKGEGFTWMDIADCLIDLKAGKMWTRKYSEVEKEAVEKDIEAYRSYVKGVNLIGLKVDKEAVSKLREALKQFETITVEMFEQEFAKEDAFVSEIIQEMGGEALIYKKGFWPKLTQVLMDRYNREVAPKLHFSVEERRKLSFSDEEAREKSHEDYHLIDVFLCGDSEVLAKNSGYMFPFRFLEQSAFHEMVRAGILVEEDFNLFLQAMPHWSPQTLQTHHPNKEAVVGILKKEISARNELLDVLEQRGKKTEAEEFLENHYLKNSLFWDSVRGSESEEIMSKYRELLSDIDEDAVREANEFKRAPESAFRDIAGHGFTSIPTDSLENLNKRAQKDILRMSKDR